MDPVQAEVEERWEDAWNDFTELCYIKAPGRWCRTRDIAMAFAEFVMRHDDWCCDKQHWAQKAATEKQVLKRLREYDLIDDEEYQMHITLEKWPTAEMCEKIW